MNFWDVAILAAVAAGVALAAAHMRKTRNSGSCPGGCGCCARPCAKKKENKA